jgi:hypothetical protein
MDLAEIRPTKLISEQRGDAPDPKTEINVFFIKAIADDDPVFVNGDAFIIFRPKYELSLKFEEEDLFTQTTVFLVVFRLKDAEEFRELWKDKETRSFFSERQLVHTLWPIFRQQVLDGMSRLCMKPYTLPWILPSEKTNEE